MNALYNCTFVLVLHDKKIELEYMEKVFNCDENNVTMQKK